jgi:hypothetical protein
VRLWGWLQTFPKPENELFPGVATIALATAGCAARVLALWGESEVFTPARRAALAAIVVAGAALIGFAALVLTTGDEYWRVGTWRLTLRAPWKVGVVLALLGAALLALSQRLRRLLRGVPGSALGFFAAAAVLSALLTLGPVIEVNGYATRLPAPYAALYWHVPGFDGLRVPARYAMLTACGMAVLGGFGARALLSRGHGGRIAVWVLAAFFLAESTGAPIPLDGTIVAPGYAQRPGPVRVGAAAPDVYRIAAGLPAPTVIVEFPFGSAAWDLQAIFYQRVHRHPVINGYSGGFPASFNDNRDAFDAIAVVPDVAWRRLRTSGATHAIVHLAAIHRRDRIALHRWLTGRGATVLDTLGHDRIYTLPAQ